MAVAGSCGLPEECISHILSLTSPRDACRSSVISSEFKSAADSDTVWERFLPSDYPEIISRAVSPVVFSTKKDLYFLLCHSPVLLDGGTKSFVLDKKSGKKCYMLKARDLQIGWTSLTKSRICRFLEMAYLWHANWMDIEGRIQSRILSPNTTYAAYFVFMIKGTTCGLAYRPIKALVRVDKGEEVGNGAEGDESTVYLQPQRLNMHLPKPRDRQLPVERGDGYKEIAVGEFFNEQDDGEVKMKLREVDLSGLSVQGIELRPKE